MKCHRILIFLFYLYMVASPHDGFDLLYHSKGPWKGPPSWTAIKFPCSREEKEQVKQEQRAAGSWTVLRVWRWSTQTLLPNSSARSKPRDSTTDRQGAASLNSPPCPYKHPSGCELYYNPLCYCSFTACVSKQGLQSSFSLTRVICKQQRWVIFPRKHLLDISFISNQIQKLCLQLQRY